MRQTGRGFNRAWIWQFLYGIFWNLRLNTVWPMIRFVAKPVSRFVPAVEKHISPLKFH